MVKYKLGSLVNPWLFPALSDEEATVPTGWLAAGASANSASCAGQLEEARAVPVHLDRLQMATKLQQ